MDSGRVMALQVVERALSESVELMVALQYLGMLQEDALAPLREIAAAVPIVERIAEVPAVPVSRQEIMEQQRARREMLRQRHTAPGVAYPRFDRSPPSQKQASLFAEWVDGRIAWSPAVMGWASDDPRVDQARELGIYE